MEKTSRGDGAPPHYLDLPGTPHVLNKKNILLAPKPGPVINTPLLLFVGLFGLGGAFFPHNVVFSQLAFLRRWKMVIITITCSG